MRSRIPAILAGLALVAALAVILTPARPAVAAAPPGFLEVLRELAARPISPGDIDKIRSAPIDTGEWTTYTQAVSTTPLSALSSDIAAANRVATYGRNFRFSNRHASQGLCFGAVAFSSACSSTCSGSGLTCSGASTDGDYIAPGTSYTIALTGNMCACLVASAASTTATAAAVQRSAE